MGEKIRNMCHLNWHQEHRGAVRPWATSLLIALLLVATGCRATSKSAAVRDDPPAPDNQPPQALLDVDAKSLPAVLAAHVGHGLLVNVWSTWCAPCVEEMPLVVATAKKYSARGLRLVFISADSPTQRDAALEVLRAVGARGPSYLKTGPDDEFIAAFHGAWSGALPATLLIDDTGVVAKFWNQPLTSEELVPAIEQVLAPRTNTKE